MSTSADVDQWAAQLRSAMAEEIFTRHPHWAPDWRAAVETVPRHVFTPQFYTEDRETVPTSWTPTTPETVGTERWLEAAYRDESLITQFDDDEPDWRTRVSNRVPSSSSTLPSLVVRMLHVLDLHGGERVLEIGTGTGYSTALMCARLGEEQVASVETDPTIAHAARAALVECGFRPHLAVHDGLQGWWEHAPYDRVIATCGVRAVPWAWVTQSRHGGKILVALRGWGWPIGLASLNVDRHGAEGRFLADDVSFMIARQQDAPADLGTLPSPEEGQERPTQVGPDVLTDHQAAPVAAIAVPTARNFTFALDGTPPATYVLDHPTRSAAVLSRHGARDWKVRQVGPQRLWDRIEDAVTTWREAGCPSLTEFGLTVTADTQHIWLGSLDGPQRSLSY